MRNIIKNIAVVANPNSENIRPVLLDLIEILRRYNVNILFEKRAADVMEHSWHTTERDIREKADLLIVVGGDGTVLSAARLLEDSEIPILGIHMGRLGFITEINPDEMRETITAVMEKRLPTNRRMRLTCDVIKDGKVIYSGHALNDITINKGGLAQMVEFDVFVDEHKVAKYRADGFIVSTPTGSTGYALSAGGSIVDPGMELILLCPICSHSINTREVIIPADRTVKINLLQPRNDIYVAQDGQSGKNLLMGETLVVKKAEFSTVLYHSPERNFFDHLRTKFGWTSK